MIGSIAFFYFYIMLDMTEAEKNSIIEMLAPMLDRDGIELVDVETHSKTLRLLIHKPDGLSVADCQTVNQIVRPILEVHKHLENYAQLEVASPGIDRPLRTAKDFQRNYGRTVRIEIEPKNEQKRQVQGTVVEVRHGEVVLAQTGGNDISVKISQNSQCTYTPELVAIKCQKHTLRILKDGKEYADLLYRTTSTSLYN